MFVRWFLLNAFELFWDLFRNGHVMKPYALLHSSAFWKCVAGFVVGGAAAARSWYRLRPTV
jgi:hypothetical protein